MSYVLALTWLHTLISLVALFLGIPAILRLMGGRPSSRWTTAFLAMAAATAISGFMFPFAAVTPAFATGLVASAILAMVVAARSVFRLAGPWRWIYSSGVVVSVYLLAFVGVVQAFQKLPLLNGLAPTQTELPFLVAQIGTLAGFVVLGVLAGIRFKDAVDDMPGPRLAG